MARAPHPEKTPPEGLTLVLHDPPFGYWVRAGCGLGIGIVVWTVVAAFVAAFILGLIS